MPEYYNPWSHTIELTGPNGDRIRIKGKTSKTLDEYFDRYVDRGHIEKIGQKTVVVPLVQSVSNIKITTPLNRVNISDKHRSDVKQQSNNVTIRKSTRLSQPKAIQEQSPVSQARKIITEAIPAPQVQQSTKIVPTAKGLTKSPAVAPAGRNLHARQQNTREHLSRNKVVGKQLNGDALAIYNSNSASIPYRISNGIAICVLSYNRSESLRRLIESIRRTVDLDQVVLFISDDASTDAKTITLLNDLSNDSKIVVIKNEKNIGIAGNTNRLLRCAQRFEHIFLVNDDVQFLTPGWDQFYINKAKQSGIHHACFRQPGVYGAKHTDHQIINIHGVDIESVSSKPHGAMLYLSNKALKTCGYFNEEYKKYGMEHVDWSLKPAEFGLQPAGFFDFSGSQNYVLIHPENSSVPDRGEWYRKNKDLFTVRKEKYYAEPTNESVVNKVTYLVPCRDHERIESIRTVLNGIIGQSFPEIEIILIEQDISNKINIDSIPPVNYIFVGDTNRGLFNKSKAFNKGAFKSTSEYLILHDADMLSRVDYTKTIFDLLQSHEAIHICGKVLYMDVNTTNATNHNNKIPQSPIFERMIGYFEGGSLAIRKSSYWNIGAFNEDYWGYGCFLPGNKVITNRGLINIEDVRKSDELLTHQGNYKKQIARIRNYNGPVLDIFIPGRLPIKGVTPNHPFLVHDVNNEYVWREARYLKNGDLLAQTDILPDLSPTIRFQDIINSDKSHNKFDIDSNINNLSYIIGLYLSEGVIQEPNRLRTTYLFLHQAELFLAENVRNIINRLNPNISVNYEYVKKNCRHVVISNSFLTKLIYSVCGKHRSVHKIISPEFWSLLTNEALSNLLGGLFDGDAGHQFNSEKRLVYHTSSINLAFSVSGMMRKLGIAHSFGKRKGGNFENSQKYSYDLTVNREFEHLINSLYNKPEYYGSNSTGKSQFGAIYDIREYQYDGLVYNFEVEDDHSYYVHGVSVHNCEDCDFYARAKSLTTWLSNEDFDLVHLWHSRVPNWDDHHNENKKLEAKLSLLPIEKRIELQQKQIREIGYIS